MLNTEISIFSFLVACISCFFLEKYSLVNIFSNFNQPSGTEKFLIDNRHELIMINLEGGKTYIGQLLGFDTWSKGHLNSIVMSPLFSGVRSEINKQLEINTSYFKYSEGRAITFEEKEPIEHVILFKRVINMSRFDLTAFSKHVLKGTVKINKELKDFKKFIDDID